MTHWVLYITAATVGLLLGSFLNVVIHRGPRLWKLLDGPDRGNLAFPRSYCPSCKAPIRFLHLPPIAGFLMLRGKCADCGARIALRYPLVELAGAASGLVALYLFGLTFTALFAFVFFLFVIALGVIDFETGYLPDALTIPLVFLGVLANAFDLFNGTPGAAVIGMVAGFAAFRLVDLAFRRLRGMEGLGQGDAKLLAALGAWFGWAVLPPIVFLAALVALIGVGAAALQGAKIDKATPVPFGPALVTAGALAMIAHGLRLPLFF